MGSNREPTLLEKEMQLVLEAQERRVERALDALLGGAEDWWRHLDSNDLTHRRESGVVMARVVKAIRSGLVCVAEPVTQSK